MASISGSPALVTYVSDVAVPATLTDSARRATKKSEVEVAAKVSYTASLSAESSASHDACIAHA
eukprot:8478628-Pyramimonas_sp.AAC.1